MATFGEIVSEIKNKPKTLGEIAKEEQESMATQISAGPSLGKRVVGEVIEPTVEGIAFGLGEMAGGPVGAGLLYSGARGIFRRAGELVGTRQPTTLKEELITTGKDFVTGAVMSMGGQIVGAGISKGIEKAQPYRGRLFEEVPGVGKRLKPELKAKTQTFDKYGIDYTFADIVPDANLPSKIEKLLEYYPGSGDTAFKSQIAKIKRLNELRNEMVQKHSTGESIGEIGRAIKDEVNTLMGTYRTAKNTKLNAMLDDFADTFGIRTKSEAGARFDTLLMDTREAMKVDVRTKYDTLQSNLPLKGADIVPDINIQKTARELLNEQMAIKAGERDKGLITRLEGYLPKEKVAIESKTGGGFKISEKMLERDPTLRAKGGTEEMTWYGLDKTRSSLLERNRDIFAVTKRWDTAEQRVNSKLIDAIESDMGEYAKSQGDDIWKLYENARMAARREHELFDKDILKIMNLPPEQVVRRVIKEGDQGLTLLRQIKAISGEEGIRPLRQNFFGELIDSSTRNGRFDPLMARKTLKKLGNESLEELCTADQIGWLNNIVDKGIRFDVRTSAKSKMGTWKFLEMLSKKNDTGIVNTILQPGNNYNVYLAKKLLSPERLQELKAQALEKVLVLSGTGNYLPVSSARKLATGQGTGLEIPLKKLLGSEVEGLKEFIEMGQNMQRVEQLAKNTSFTAPSLEMFGAVRRFIKNPIKATVAFVTQNTLAKIYFNPRAKDFMLRAWSLPVSSRLAVENFTKAVLIVSQEEP